MTTATTTGKNIAPNTLGTESAPAQLVPSLEDAADNDEAASKEPISARTWFIIVLCAVAQYNLTFYAIAPPANSYAIAGPLNGMDKRMWIAQCQGIPSIVTGPIMAIISDLYGRRWVVIPAFLLMIVANIISMTTSSMNLILVSQTLMGVAYGVSAIIYAIPSEIVAGRYRGWVQTALGVGASFSAVTAVIGMGAATSIDPVNGWRWIFRSTLIGNVIVVVGLFFFYIPPARAPAPSSLWARFKSLDWIGYFLLFAGLVPFLMGFAWASNRDFGWKDPHAYGCVAAGTVGFTACLLYEWKGRDDGFIHHELFRHGPNFPIAVVLIAVEGALFYLINNIWSSQVITLYTKDTLVLGCYIIPFFLATLFISPVISAYVVRYRDVKWPIAAGFVFFLAATIGLGTATENSKKAVLGYITLAGIGFTAPLIFVVSLVQLSTPPLFIGITTALTISARTLGGTVGYAIAEAVYGSQTNDKVPAAIAASVLPLGFDPANLGQLIGALLSGQGIGAVPGASGPILAAATAAAKKVQARAFRIIWLSSIPAVVIAIVATCFFKNPKGRMNWSVDAPLTKVVPGADGHQEEGLEFFDSSLEKQDDKGSTEHREHRHE